MKLKERISAKFVSLWILSNKETGALVTAFTNPIKLSDKTSELWEVYKQDYPIGVARILFPEAF